MTTNSTASDTRSGRCIFSTDLETRAEWRDAALAAVAQNAGFQNDDAPSADAAWRGVAPLWAAEQPYGLWQDQIADPNSGGRVSDLEKILTSNPLDDTATLNRARDGMEWWRLSGMCKYSAQSGKDPTLNVPYVLVLDEPKSTSSEADLREMLVFAQTELLNAHVVILPVADGHFTQADASTRITVVAETANPWLLFESATSVYTVASPLGFNAVIAGHRPRVFGQPWYSGWNLTQDENAPPRRERRLTRAQLFAGAMLTYTSWHHPRTGACITFEAAMAIAEARHRAAQIDAKGYVISNLANWKHRAFSRYFGASSVEISDAPTDIAKARSAGAIHMVWGADSHADMRLEDGFLRSKGLGAALVPPVSLVQDDLGIYFDPNRPSRLEQLIGARADLPPHADTRIQAFLTALKTAGLSKYNVGRPAPALPEGEKILVVGQVEDDASIRLGAGDINTNAALLKAARDTHPDAYIVYKPHPDVEAKLRKGHRTDGSQHADFVARDTDPITLIQACDHIWTMTSLLGFEALLHGRKVTCTGAPFYAGWGLTHDLGRVPARRGAAPSLIALAHATLIDYPRYFNPENGAAISPEEALALLNAQPQQRNQIMQKMLAIAVRLRDAAKGIMPSRPKG